VENQAGALQVGDRARGEVAPTNPGRGARDRGQFATR